MAYVYSPLAWRLLEAYLAHVYSPLAWRLLDVLGMRRAHALHEVAVLEGAHLRLRRRAARGLRRLRPRGLHGRRLVRVRIRVRVIGLGLGL